MVVVSGRGTAEGDGNGLATEVDIIVVVGCFEMKKWRNETADLVQRDMYLE